MRAAVLSTSPGKLSISEVAIEPPGPHEVLIRTVAAGLCHSDLHVLDGHWEMPLPLVPGHESAGVVLVVGDAVTSVRPGDHVVTCLSIFCGSCEYCLAGRPNLCDRIGVDRADDEAPRLRLEGDACGQLFDIGAFAEQMLVHENAVAVIPDDVPLDLAALIGCSVLTGVGAIVRTAAVRPGSTVAVIGCGGVGLNCIQGARLVGARRIVAIDQEPHKLVTARAFGATDVIDARREDPVAAIHELFPGGGGRWGGSSGVEYSFEAIGLKRTAEQAFAMLRKGGVATLIGAIPPGVSLELPGVDFFDERRIQGCSMGSNRFRHDVPEYIELYRQGRLELESLVSARLAIDEINDGFDRMRRGEVARCVVTFPA
jgi:S-(hydroxymethyl)glutathione dehydrogenase/alcohol dehydrogenase